MARPNSAAAEPAPSHAAETEAAPGLDGRVADPPDQTGRSSGHIRPSTNSPAEPDLVAGSDMSVPRVGLHTETAESELQTAHQPPEDDQQRPGVHGHVRPTGLDSSLSLSPSAGERDTVATAAELEGGQGIRAHEGVLSVQHLDAHGGDGQSPQPSPKWTCIHIGSDSGTPISQGENEGLWKGQDENPEQGEVTGTSNELDRSTLLGTVAGMVLQNPNNWCFANAAVFSLLWSTLSLRDFSRDTWGTQCDQFCAFLARMTSESGNLSFEDWFRQVLRCWDRCELAQLVGSISQQDAAEFIQVWLEQLQSPAFDMSWERRLEEKGVTHVIDECKGPMPLLFQFDEITLQLSTFSLTLLSRLWHQVDGMKTGTGFDAVVYLHSH